MTQIQFDETLRVFCRQREESAKRCRPEDREHRMTVLSDLYLRCSKLEPERFPTREHLSAYLTQVYGGLIADRRARQIQENAWIAAISIDLVGAAAVEMPAPEWLDLVEDFRSVILDGFRACGKLQLELTEMINLEVFLWREVAELEFDYIAAHMGDVYDTVDFVYEVRTRSDDARRKDKVSTKTVRTRAVRAGNMLRYHQVDIQNLRRLK